jgi:predicted ATPase/DNA-binding SARP family transcriptional activator
MGNQDSAPVSPLELRFFGPFAARVGGSPLPPLRTRKGQWLLALLALRSPRPVEREWLAATLWPESLGEQSLASLRRTLTDLRNALGPEEARIEAPTARTLRLNLDGAFVDALRFDAAVRAGDWETACALYAGPFLEDCHEEWAITDRANREEAFVCAQLRHAEAAFARGDFAEAAANWRRLVALNPLHEPAQRGLLESLCASGDHAEAIAVYRDLRVRLRGEYNAEPGAETTAIFDRVRSESRDRARAGHAPLPRPRVVAAKLPEPSDRRGAVGPLPRRLPVFLTGFIGRDRELSALFALLRARRLVTLVGMGGIGKTRLAVAAAEQLLDYAPDGAPDGAFFADLSAVREPSHLARAVAGAVGLDEPTGNDPAAVLIESLRPRALLLVLDNCEHLIESVAGFTEGLLAHCPGLRILATSREPLRVGAESVFRVPPLSRPDPCAPADSLLAHEAVQLFVERAEAVRPDFRATEETLPLVARVCARLDGIALALELAAARLSALSLEQVAVRLDDRLHLLTVGSRTAQPRQRTLRAALDWSYDLLTEPERALLRRLSVFASGFTVASARAVCLPDGAEWETLELLTALVDKSLIAPAGGERYRLLETVREYGGSLLEVDADEAATVTRRFGEHFAERAREASEQMRQGEQHQAVATLAAEDENIRAAALALLADPITAVVGQKMAVTLSRFWTMRNGLAEAARWGDRALAATVAENDTEAQRTRVRLLICAGVIARRQGDYDRAEARQAEALEVARGAGDVDGAAAALGNLALLADNRGDYERSQALREEGLELERPRGDQYSIAQFLHNIANIAQRRRDLTTAFARYDECMALQRETGDREGLAWSMTGYCYCLINRREAGGARDGDDALLRKFLAESLPLFREFEDKEGIVGTLCLLATEAGEVGDLDGFRAHLSEAMDVLEALTIYCGKAGRARDAAVFYGVGDALMTAQGTRATPPEAAQREARMVPLSEALGADEWGRAYAEGRALSLADALAAGRRVTASSPARADSCANAPPR